MRRSVTAGGTRCGTPEPRSATAETGGSMNPFEQKPKKSYMDLMKNWKGIEAKPYDKLEADPYTKARIILMNGIEVEAALFGHNFHRHCEDNDLRREIALCRRMEQMQQKHVNWLSPSNETTRRADHRLRAAGRRPDGMAGHARARRVFEGLHGLRPAGGLRPSVPLRQPAEDRRGHSCPQAHARHHRVHAGPSDHRPSPPPLRRRAHALATPRRPTSAPRWAP